MFHPKSTVEMLEEVVLLVELIWATRNRSLVYYSRWADLRSKRASALDSSKSWSERVAKPQHFSTANDSLSFVVNELRECTARLWAIVCFQSIFVIFCVGGKLIWYFGCRRIVIAQSISIDDGAQCLCAQRSSTIENYVENAWNSLNKHNSNMILFESYSILRWNNDTCMRDSMCTKRNVRRMIAPLHCIHVFTKAN